VTYGGAGLPPEARVVAIAVADEADVNSGDILVRVEPT
jgi:multidrug resistance efflux pump